MRQSSAPLDFDHWMRMVEQRLRELARHNHGGLSAGGSGDVTEADLLGLQAILEGEISDLHDTHDADLADQYAQVTADIAAASGTAHDDLESALAEVYAAIASVGTINYNVPRTPWVPVVHSGGTTSGPVISTTINADYNWYTVTDGMVTVHGEVSINASASQACVELPIASLSRYRGLGVSGVYGSSPPASQNGLAFMNADLNGLLVTNWDGTAQTIPVKPHLAVPHPVPGCRPADG